MTEKKPTKYLVIGFPKCGQTSLAEYLHKRFGSENNADRGEIIWKPDGIELFEKNGYAENYRPVIIIRDPIKRIWSDWNHLGRGYGFKTFEEYLQNKKQEGFGGLGEYNPVKRSNYEKYIKRWAKYDPIVLELEEMQKNPNFPHHNKGTEYDEKYNDIPQHYRELCESFLMAELTDSS